MRCSPPQIILFGVVICLDSFLYTFTILPLRSAVAAYHLVANGLHNLFRPRARRKHMRLSHKCDLTKTAILAGAMFVLHRITDASIMYHSVRGQDTIKLYVLFNVLEVRQALSFPRIVQLTKIVIDCRSLVLLFRPRPARFALLKGHSRPTNRRKSSSYPPCCLVWPQSCLRW